MDKGELAAVKKAIRAIQWSRNPDPEQAGHEDYATIVKYCANTSIHNLFADLRTEAESNDYQPNNKQVNDVYFHALDLDVTRVSRPRHKSE
jgi:hypothetical protein